MKLLKAFLICFITSAAFAAGGTHVIQGDNVTVSSLTVTAAMMERRQEL